MDTLDLLKSTLGENRIRLNEPLLSHTTIKVGGPARYYFSAETLEDLTEAVRIARESKLPFLLLGSGSTFVFSSKGYDGLIIKNNARKIEMRGMKGKITNGKLAFSNAQLYGESGVTINQFVRFSLDQGLSGLEYFIGRAGTLGGGMYKNIMAENVSIGENLISAVIFNENNEIVDVDASYFRFGSDKPMLQKTEDIILSAIFQLDPMDKDLLWGVADKIASSSSNKEPLDSPFCGKVFKDILKSEAMRAATPDLTTSAQFLLEKAQIANLSIGNARVYEYNPNYIVAQNAQPDDIFELKDKMKQSVKKKFGVQLREETQFVG